LGCVDPPARLEPASSLVWQLPLPNKLNPNSGIDYYLQIGASTDDRLRALAALFAQVAHEPCFDTLRTKQQLGYLVSSGGRAQSGMVGFHILVQSQNDSVYLENCIESFLKETMRESLDKMTAEEFERHKQSLIDKKLQKVKNLYVEPALARDRRRHL
jgi:insulysin